MKSRRPFVVEHKFSRRRSASQVKSIWGTTDLKAVARSAASDAPELFTETSSPDHVVNDGSSLNVQADLVQPIKPNERELVPAPALASNAELTSSLKRSPKLPGNNLSRKAAGTPQDRPGSKGHVDATVTECSTAPSLDGVPSDAVLQSLQSENSYLRGLLIRHLREQNAMMKEMLAR